VVGKYGNTTKFTLGNYSGMDAYTCTEFGLESREVVVYNYKKGSDDFSAKGDSGSLIFTGDGIGLAILHSGMARGMHNHATYGTPLWWVFKQLLDRYPMQSSTALSTPSSERKEHPTPPSSSSSLFDPLQPLSPLSFLLIFCFPFPFFFFSDQSFPTCFLRRWLRCVSRELDLLLIVRSFLLLSLTCGANNLCFVV
jgi:hypothetical protein